MLLVMASTLPVIAVKVPVIAVTAVPWRCTVPVIAVTVVPCRRTLWFWGNWKALVHGGSRSKPLKNAIHGAEATLRSKRARKLLEKRGRA